jgi:hypothetical protein
MTPLPKTCPDNKRAARARVHFACLTNTEVAGASEVIAILDREIGDIGNLADHIGPA